MNSHITRCRAFVASVALIAAAGCGGGSGGEPAPQSKADRIQYAEATAVGKGRLADYMNADWLYDNYFGHLGLPPEIRPRLMIDMQRLANGFALQFGLGEDVVSTTAHFHATMNSAAGQAMLARFAARLHNGDAGSQLAAGTRPDAQALAEQPAMSALDLTHAAAARESDRTALLNLQTVAVALELPYDLMRDATPLLSWSAGLIAHKTKGGGYTGWTSIGQPVGGAPAPAPGNQAHGTDTWPWTHGDIMLLKWNEVDDPNKDAFPLGHVAIVDVQATPSEKRLLPRAIDAHPNNPGRMVTVHVSTHELTRRYKLIQAHRTKLPYDYIRYCDNWGFGPNCGNQLTRRSHVREYAVESVRARVGTLTYSPFVGKNSQAETYCSLLVWSAYKEASERVRRMVHDDGRVGSGYNYDTIDVDLDSDGGLWVFPNDIVRSPWVQDPFRVSDRRPTAVGGPVALAAAERQQVIDYARSPLFQLPVRDPWTHEP